MTSSQSEQWTHHAVTINGRDSNEMNDTIGNARDRLRRMLDRIDGQRRYSLTLWERPAGKRLNEINEATEVVEYIQSAGSSQAMTVEIRVGVGDEAKQFVVGRPAEHSGEPDVDIPWDGYISTVYPNEVFDAAEATKLFSHYLVDATVPPEYSLRCLDLSRPTTRPR
jgi:hypothetical protein